MTEKNKEINYEDRRQLIFLLLSGVFIGAMAMLNVIGITKFISIGPLQVAVGVLPYPITFLCTDLIGEFYGRKKASQVVWIGLLVNALVLSTMWLGEHLPSVSPEARPPWQTLELAKDVYLPNGAKLGGSVDLFSLIYANTAGAVFASMAAYLAAQFCDVHLFHFWKKLTKGKHLWLRNNASTTVSQLVDSITVIGITFGAAFYRGEMTLSMMAALLVSNYLFKVSAALIDTIPFYLLTHRLKKYLNYDPSQHWMDE